MWIKSSKRNLLIFLIISKIACEDGVLVFLWHKKKKKTNHKTE